MTMNIGRFPGFIPEENYKLTLYASNVMSFNNNDLDLAQKNTGDSIVIDASFML